jgi:Zn finger protein HypA/HybF involved in hydrogenase expression
MNTDANKKSRTLVLSTNTKNSLYYKEIYFLLCESCFWCATRFVIEKDYDSGSCGNANHDTDNNISILSKCPLCNKEKVESMPIANGESYRFDYNAKRGITLEFF